MPVCANSTYTALSAWLGYAPRRPPMKRALAISAALLALAVFAPMRSAPAQTSCSAACDKAASSCDDVCEAQHKDAKPRIECKLRCIAEREKCEKGCK